MSQPKRAHVTGYDLQVEMESLVDDTSFGTHLK